jgi:hypothetical protein
MKTRLYLFLAWNLNSALIADRLVLKKLLKLSNVVNVAWVKIRRGSVKDG